MIYVLDQNYLRSDELKALIVSDTNAKFVIPDIALVEMCKGERWRDIMQMSLSTLSACPTRVFQSMAVGEALNYELQHLKSIEGKLLPKNFRAFIRSILDDVQTGTSTKGTAPITSQIAEVQSDMRDKELNHAKNQASLVTRTAIIRKALGPEVLRHLKNGLSDDTSRLVLIRRVAVDLLTDFLLAESHNINRIKFFLKSKPLLLRYFIVSVRHAFEWAIANGLDSMPAERVTNDILDQDYVVIASFFDAILSKETKVNAADSDLRAILQMDS